MFEFSRYTGNDRLTKIRRGMIISPLSFVAMVALKDRMEVMMSEVRNEEDEEYIRRSPQARALITNDGRTTFVVHSAMQEDLEDILHDGLKFAGRQGRPNLRFNAIMLAARGERQARRRNIHSLAYRCTNDSRNIKLVYEFDQPNPGTSFAADPFIDTFLAKEDGVYIGKSPIPADPYRALHQAGLDYAIPPHWLKGYFDLDAQRFALNPDFGQPTSQR
jgi:hypothetical protein